LNIFDIAADPKVSPKAIFEQQLGIGIGVGVGILCIIICVTFVVYKQK